MLFEGCSWVAEVCHCNHWRYSTAISHAELCCPSCSIRSSLLVKQQASSAGNEGMAHLYSISSLPIKVVCSGMVVPAAFCHDMQAPEPDANDLSAEEVASVKLFQLNTPSVVNISNIGP